MATNRRTYDGGIPKMFKWLISKIPTQRNTGQVIGAAHVLLGRTTFYISIINFLLLIVTAYYTTIRNFIAVPFIWFLSFTVLIVIFAMIIEYVVILPSSIIFNNIQMYKHDNPLKDDIKLVLERLDDIEEQLK